MAVEFLNVCAGIESDAAELAEPVEQQAGIAQPLDVFTICVEHDHLPDAPLHQRGGDATDRTGADDQDPGFDYVDSPPSNCIGGASRRSEPSAA
jgi:hypothetical protein